MLAERSRVSATLFAAALVVAGSLLFLKQQPDQPNLGVVTIENHVVLPGPGLVRVADCPEHVLKAIGLSEYEAVICARGQFPEPATFAIAYYRTTEWWERLAIVRDDGTFVVPRTDRPSLHQWTSSDESWYELADLNSDGIDEAVGWFDSRPGRCAGYRRAEIIRVENDTFSFMLSPRMDKRGLRPSSCALGLDGTIVRDGDVDDESCNVRVGGSYRYNGNTFE